MDYGYAFSGACMTAMQQAQVRIGWNLSFISTAYNAWEQVAGETSCNRTAP